MCAFGVFSFLQDKQCFFSALQGNIIKVEDATQLQRE